MSLVKTLYEKDLYPEIDEAGQSDFARDCVEVAAARLARGDIDRRTFMQALAFLGALPAAAALGGRSAGAAAKELVVVNWGGPAVEAYAKAFGAPFEKATGTKVVIDGTGPLGSKIKAMVDAKLVPADKKHIDPGQPENLALQVLQNGPWYEEDSGVRNLTNDELSREKWLDTLSS